jgi:UDP-N-acetylmuramoyl-tripeptide--D-alanyl-D-alanine ligase
MITLSLTATAAALNGELHGDNTNFSGVSTDTRTLKPGELFVALKGDRYDGHDSLADAARQGAVGALLAKACATTIPYVRVRETRPALGLLARFWRSRYVLPVIGITGSNGKTTTKEITAAILRERGSVLATKGNLNNDIGVPLTLFELAPTHHAAVIEMGANGPQDIAVLAEIARPTVGVVTMCGPAHLAGFGSIDKVAEAKGKLLESLDATGTAVINSDDKFSGYWRQISRAGTLVTFGIEQPADYRAHGIELCPPGRGSQFELRSPLGTIVVTLRLDGLHNIYNALAAAAAAIAAGASLENVRSGLASTPRVAGRLILKKGVGGCQLIDDSYNANPASLAAALAVLAQVSGARWLVLGDMGELGPDELVQHRDAGILARGYGIERLLTLGKLAQAAAEGFGPGGEHFPDRATLVAALRERVAPGVTLLIKGSRMMQMEKVVGELAAPEACAC